MRHMSACHLLAVLLAIGIASTARGTDHARPEWLNLADGTPMLERAWSTDQCKFTFAIIGDKWSGGERNWPIFDRAVDEINLLRPDFVITVGDLIPGHMLGRDEWDREWREFFTHANRLQVPFLFLPGNHDISNPEMYRWWKQDFGRTYYSFDYQGCHFLALNTEEDRLDGRGEVWEEMLRFAERDLREHRDARHTFVFMHKPMWIDERYESDWPRVERALEGRRYTVAAGHWHDLQFERRNGMVHLVVSGTGAGVSENPIRELGSFHHYTMVTVDGDSVAMAVVEPGGPMWPVDIATRQFREAVANVVRIEGSTAERLDGMGDVTIRPLIILSNALPESATVAVRLNDLTKTGWTKTSGADSFIVQLAPGQVLRRTYVFLGDEARLSPLPGFGSTVRYKGEWIEGRRAGYAPLLPDTAMRVVQEWMLIGPFDIGPIDTRYLPNDPRRGVPGLFERQEPDGFWAGEGTVIEDGDTLSWQKVRAQSTGYMNYNAYIGTRDHALAYARCSVYSPTEQIVYAELSADNFAQVVVNGELLEHAQVFGGPVTPLYARIPLKAGWNTLGVKLVNNSGDWWLHFRIADPSGNLRFAARPR